MSSSMMETEPGGESTQYESISTVNKSHRKELGQFDAGHENTEAAIHAAQQQQERGEKTAENIRFGEALSEHGFGGETTTNSGTSSNPDKIATSIAPTDAGGDLNTRSKQGYGAGSGVGA